MKPKAKVPGTMRAEDTELRSYHTVMSYELDSFGHVNNAVYLNYLEKARNDFMHQRGLDFYDFFRWKRFPVVVRSILEHKYPAKAGDRLVIDGAITHHTATSFTLGYRIYNPGTKKIITTGETFHVFVDEKNKPSRIPREFFEKFLA
jgi:acyl-CoA thioester hydrolase